ncbi:hypothetical protein AB0F77_23190 [Streptomyces sp. NPDC026672]|uniref:hypothetical protein n=1 Tax=unclassified Streptomyces TaxID=2593676 RepID=UPI0033C8F4EB
METTEDPERPQPLTEPVAAPRPRRRGRTTLLIATAAGLGLVAGTCTGYLIQADRKPTALPPLPQPVLTRAGGTAPEPLSAAEDRAVKTDGDLRKLLLTRPGGARDASFEVGEDGWLNLAGYAETFNEPGSVFGELLTDEFRRAAVTTWREDNAYDVEIRLVQFRQEENVEASQRAGQGYFWANKDPDTEGSPIGGTGDGTAYVRHRPDSGGEYSAEAHAWRGDVVMEIWVSGTKPVPKRKIVDLAERQMERL